MKYLPASHSACEVDDIRLADAANRVLVQEPEIKTVAKHLLK